MSVLPTGTVTILFTDIEGSTRLWEQFPEAMQDALARHDELLRAAVEAHQGHVIKTTGDGIHAMFGSAGDAVLAVLDAQRTVQAEEWGDVGAIRVRMGLHTGEVVQREGDYFAPALNRAARLMAAGHGGQILLSAATYELVRDHLPPSAEMRDLGDHRLKDLIRSEHIFQLTVPDLPTQFPLLKTLDSRANNLPAQQSAFIGRERELASVRVLVERSDVRVVTLTGPGGTGKTRLALQVAADLLEDFAQGVYFVPLASVSDPALVVATIATTLGLRESGDQPIQEILLSYLRDKEMLLVLDNFEQVLAAAPAVGTLLTAAPGVKVLVTSRTALRLYGEQEFAVPPLTLPTLGHLPAIDVLTQYEAVALFIQRAHLAKPDFAVTNDNAPAVAEICVRLDGLPLAIELAAARVKLLPPQALLTRLESRLKVLTGGARDLPARQQTLRGAIDWSYNLLDPGEQTLFAWLSVFVGGCTLEAVEDVCTRVGGLPGDVLDGLSSLVDQSLVRQEENSTSGVPRFTILETIREYAEERLAQSGAWSALRVAHTGHMLSLAEVAEQHLTGAEQATWLACLEEEHDNLRSALRWAQESGAEQVGLHIAAAVWRFWLARGYLNEGQNWLEGLLGRREEQEISAAAVAMRAKALNGAGSLAHFQGDYARARVLFEESLTLHRGLGDKQGIASSLNNMANIVYRQGDYARATVLYEESLALFREVGNKQGIANSLANLGGMAEAQGDHTRAQILHEESLALFRELSDTGGIANSLGSLGDVAHDQGDYARATVLHEESLALFREVGNKQGIAYALYDLGKVAYEEGDYAQAMVLHKESEALFREMGNKQGIAAALSNLGKVAHEQGDYTRATVLHEESVALRQEVGDRRGIALSLEGLARVASVSGKEPEALKRALRLLGAAASLRAGMGAPMPRSERPDYERTVTALRAALGNTEYEEAWAEGQALTLEEAMVLALGDTIDGLSCQHTCGHSRHRWGLFACLERRQSRWHDRDVSWVYAEHSHGGDTQGRGT